MNRRWLANTSPPRPSELPSPRALARATAAVVILALATILVAVLPAERGIDPTGMGGILGLTEMGEFKVEAEKEFAATAALVEATRVADSLSAATATPPR